MSALLVRQLPIDPIKGTWYFFLDGDPSSVGFAASVDSLALRVDASGLGRVYKKTGGTDTGWTEITGGSSGSSPVATTALTGTVRVDNDSAGDPQALTAAGHLLDADPHPQYALDSEKGAASGIATLTASSKLTASQLPLGTSSTTACAGDDSRLSDARTPTAHASTHAAAGTDPLTLSESQITNLVSDLAAKEATANKGAASGYASLDGSIKVPIAQIPTGSSSTTVCIGNDSRLSDARTPTAHHASHQNGGSDEVATATAGANAIPKAGAGGTLAIGWIPTGSSSSTVCIGNDSRLSDSRTPTSHVLADTAGLGSAHTTSGLTAGQVLRATGATTAAFQALVAGDIPSIAESQVTNLTTDLAAKEATANKNAASGYCGLGSDSRVPASQSRSPTLRASANVALSASTTINVTALDLAVLNGDVWVLDYFIPVTVSGGTVGLKPIFTGVTSTLAGTMECQGNTTAVTATTYARSTTPTTALGTGFITASFTGFVWVRAVITVSAANGSIRFGLATGTSAAGNILAGASLMATKV